MSQHDDRGMVTAEYTVGTLGAVMIAVVLYKFGLLDNNNPWIESLKDILERALGWGTIKSILPGFGMRLM
ncbi:hypothetical protein C6I20_14100 [Aeromicrobium sp. A1-2]|uniref:DUF4244 domain-containing protein n=1 Tax=Aeromicrobium sp. A1-2 TaxID=2107713 RepID=UPI000E54772D|nr:DUF4244 domain-containing protein [Aeromicrobium sp. A1-2]AXT86200.1 hypothetical protein C6I20_14100 [Aeromicrobium sp. A1-2]